MNPGIIDFRPTQKNDTNEPCRRPQLEVKPLPVYVLNLFIRGSSKARQLQRGSVLPSQGKQTQILSLRPLNELAANTRSRWRGLLNYIVVRSQ